MTSLPIYFRFSQVKGLAILEYLLEQLGGQSNYMALLKLAYFADRRHIRLYARPISFDYYKAMQLGAFPQGLADNIKSLNFPDSVWDNAALNGYTLALKFPSSLRDELSESDREAMNWAIEKFGAIAKKNQFDIANLTHAYPEWDRFKDNFIANPKTALPMSYGDFVKTANPEHEEFKKLGITDPFAPLADQDQEDILEEMFEISQNA
jgi:hypothetical protein